MDPIEAAVVFAVSLVIGTVAILAAVRLVVDRDAGVGNAAFTALVGAAIWAVAGFLSGWLGIPGLEGWVAPLGAVVMLVVWVGLINWRYPGRWTTAAVIGLVAWVVAVVLVYALAFVGVLEPEALGIPGA